MNKLIFIYLFIFSLSCFSQRETDNWFFGDKAGIVFNAGDLSISNKGQIVTETGSSSISSNQGDLLFYTNGATIWNKNHKVMENGEDLIGEAETAQPSIIIPKPNSNSIYYVFTTRKTKTENPSLFPGIYFSEIEISNTYPLGKVIRKNIRLENSTAQRITAVHHKNGKDIWVITYGSNSYNSPDEIFFAFKVTDKGVNFRPVKTKLNEIKSSLSKGEIKASPDGSKVALSTGSNLYIYNFDNETGLFSRFKSLNLQLNFTDGYTCNGLTFSSNSKILYYSSFYYERGNNDSYNIMQLDLNNTGLFFFGEPIFTTTPDRVSASAQLASDGKIYIAQINSERLFDYGGQPIGFDLTPFNTLGVINDPNKLGTACNYVHDAINLEDGLSYFGLPNFIQSYFRNRITTENQCIFDTFTFSLDSYAPINSVVWDFGDGNTSNDIAPKHSYTTTGEYTVTATININNQDIPLYKKITVYPLPKLIPNQEIIQCDDDNDGVNLFNLYTITDKISNDNTHTYKFYRSLIDSQNDTNQISDPENFYNETNPQTIYTKTTSINGCSDIESFSIKALFRPALTISPITVCRDSENSIDEDKGLFDLRVKKSQIISDLGLSKLEKVSFFDSAENAQKSINPLPFEYISGSTTIWVKIENENGCFGISPIDLIVNHPQINLQDNYTICISPSDHPAIILNVDSSNDRFEWKDENNNTISTSNSFTLTREGEFSLTIYKVVNGIECSNSRNFTINYPPAPEILNVEVNVQSDTDNSVYISIDGNSSYEFSLDNTTYAGNGTSHSFNNVQPGIATIYIRDINKCESPTKASASIIGYPKFLTPNADGFNDYWKVYGVSTNFFKDIDIKIFNRFGKVLYVINDKNTELGWDGTYNNIKLPSNDYWFHAKLTDINDNTIDKKGHFTLKRN
ncbi:gliding motility-associated-like protein [Tenacibaculum gallaicum]|uniref:Gliding motility-associated-like protein n=1 Tax=Tenacibaculum gallaicum TaxID=561505 RepID=A0A3E0I8K2_9FLAO|nr:T9SS type B sorting domain-containing protein [Tenacibaculum gallaicum]REH54931.1 gliding motility-associated-like protein [Tenacibaculum gallaicum]